MSKYYIINELGQTVGTGDGTIPIADNLKWSLTAGTALPVQAEVQQPPSQVEMLRAMYRGACAEFCTLAGVPVKTKLEDLEYITVRQSAFTANVAKATMLTDTMAYCLQTLRFDDGRDAWDRI